MSERVDLLHHRLQTRKAEKIRTTQATQDAIDLLYSVTHVIRDLLKLREGVMTSDVQRATGSTARLRSRFLKLSPLNPDVRPRTNELMALVKSAIEAVLRANVSEGTKAFARKSLQNWTMQRTCSQPRGEQITWSDDDS